MEINFELKEVTEDGLALFTVHSKASLMPELDIEKIKQDLNVTIRCLPLDKEEKAGNRLALIAKAY